MKHLQLSFLLLLCIFGSNSYAQPFTADSSFNVTYNFHSSWAGTLTQVVEVEGKGVYIAGNWDSQVPFDPPYCINRLLPNGAIDNSFPYYIYNIDGIQKLVYLDDTIFFNTPLALIRNTSEGGLDWEFWENANQDTINRYESHDFHIFNDKSILVVGDHMVKKHQPPNEYFDVGKRYRNGVVDTTCKHKTNRSIRKLLKYDDNRILLEGVFNQYDSITTIGDGMCRIFNDGTLDTSFHSPFWFPPGYYGYKRPLHIDPDGKILVGGFFFVQGDPSIYHIARLMPNGDLDSTFNYKAVIETNDSSYLIGAVYTICPTSDNRYVVGGFFQKYEGYDRGSIVLLDYYGNVDTTAFTGGGADTIIHAHNTDFVDIIKIIPAKDDKFYAVGRFSRYDGVDGAPIVRLLGPSHLQVEDIEQDDPADFTIFPNPIIDNQFSLVVPGLAAATKIDISIFNATGAIVQNTQTTYYKNIKIDCGVLCTGTYIVKINASGKRLFSRMLVMNN